MKIKLELTEKELAALSGLMDLGVKAGGLQVAASAAHLLTKLEDAVRVDKEAAKSNIVELDRDAG